MSTGSLDKSPQSHISLIYCLNLSMNSVQPRGKQRDNYNLTRTSTSPVTLSYFHHGVGRDGGGGRREEGGEGLHLLQQSLSPPVALSLPPPPSSPNISPLLSITAFSFRAFLPSPSLWGLPLRQSPSCDIVCHCGITALASRHEQAGDAEKATLAACALLCHGVRTLRLEKQLAGKKKN